MNYNIFQMRKLSPREVKGSFYVTVSNSQKVDERNTKWMDSRPGCIYFKCFSSSFPEGLWASYRVAVHVPHCSTGIVCGAHLSPVEQVSVSSQN